MSIYANLRRLSESPVSGVTRWQCSRELTRAVLEFIGGDLDKVRRGAIDSQGRLRFTSGHGYDFISLDLLGSTNSGQARREFEDWCDAKGYEF